MTASISLWKRIVTEKRSLIVPIAIGLLLNVGVYALVVYPLGKKSAGAADRAENAAKLVRAAEQDLASARALVSGKSRAEQELTTFYGKVLPTDQMAAVRLTYTPLPNLAKKTNVRILGRRWTQDPVNKDARLSRLHVVASLQGEYESLRQFIFELETAPEFVIIDDIALTQAEVGKPLTLTLELSTYYPAGAHGN